MRTSPQLIRISAKPFFTDLTENLRYLTVFVKFSLSRSEKQGWNSGLSCSNRSGDGIGRTSHGPTTPYRGSCLVNLNCPAICTPLQFYHPLNYLACLNIYFPRSQFLCFGHPPARRKEVSRMQSTTTESSPSASVPNVKSSSTESKGSSKGSSKPRARRRASGLGGELWGDTGAPAFATLDLWREGETKVTQKSFNQRTD